MKRHFMKKKEARRGTAYIPPRIMEDTEILLEENLLAGSIWYTTHVEIAGQGMRGLYFEEGDIVSDDNYWGE